MIGSRRGAILFEALVSLTILTLTGGAVIASLAAAIAAERRGAVREARTQEADRVLTAMSLLTRRELDLRLGQRGFGELLITVSRPERELYRIAVAEEQAPERALLVTVVYRPGEAAP